ncbi:hypothetical protein [Maridesulfovibrio bastinii]|jgi:hypothetical protein|uniref:hypothetical protein n=1 Tax=Maridesulfovibrio bastinii TaxID=47157 RepID=UPI0012EC192E|nr:hypothetical protein [Maridesulfovibrio bastinii]
MEVGWYLRFGREETVMALADKGTEGQLYNQLDILPEWSLEIEEETDHIKAVFKRTDIINKKNQG